MPKQGCVPGLKARNHINLLKTIEMAEITVLSSLFFCADARDNITPLFAGQKVVLLNKSTSFKFIQ